MLNSEGVYNRFLKQELEKIFSEPKLLGLHMTWVFENETTGQAVNLTDDLYLHREVEKHLRINGRRGGELPRRNFTSGRRGKDQTHNEVCRKGF